MFAFQTLGVMADAAEAIATDADVSYTVLAAQQFALWSGTILCKYSLILCTTLSCLHVCCLSVLFYDEM